MKALYAVLLALVLGVGCGGGGGSKEKVTPKAEPPKATPNKLITDPVVEKSIRTYYILNKPTGKLTKADLEKVTELHLYSKQLTEVPKELEKLTNLKKLRFDDNQLTDVTGLEKLTKLTRLNLYDNKLTEIPKGLEKLTKLKELWLSGNQLTNVKGLEKLTQLTRLDLYKTQLAELPKGLKNLTQLTYLNLFFNPDLTKAQIDELQKALPKCRIDSNPTK